MRILLPIFIALISSAPAHADALTTTSTLNQTSSQYGAQSAYEKCTNEALNGKIDGECVGNGGSNGCVGANRSFQNSTKKSKCFIPVKYFCKLFGHEQNDSNQWVSVGMQHLANAGQCFNLAQNANDLGNSMVSDTDFLGKTGGASINSVAGNIEDGSSAFGLEEGELLKGILDGKDAASLLENSPYFKGLSAEEQEAFLEAARNPSLTATDPEYDTSGSTNPAQEAIYAQGGPSGSSSATPGGDGFGLDLLNSDDKLALSADGKDPFADALKKLENADAKKRGLASNDSALTKKYRSMLDRTIFEMVRSQYQKNMKDMIGMEQFLKHQQKQRPKDIKSIVGANNNSAKL